MTISNRVTNIRPKGQGSVSPIPYRKKNGKMGVSVFQKPELLDFRKKIAEDVKQQTKGEIIYPKPVPVYVKAIFYFMKPKTSKDEYPVTRSAVDLDKAERSLGDALTESKVFDDDSQIVMWFAQKVFVDKKEEEGVYYEIGSIKEIMQLSPEKKLLLLSSSPLPLSVSQESP